MAWADTCACGHGLHGHYGPYGRKGPCKDSQCQCRTYRPAFPRPRGY